MMLLRQKNLLAKDTGAIISAMMGSNMVFKSKQNKISWSSSNPYNKRWEFKWKRAYYTYPRDGDEHTQVRKPQDSKDSVPLYWAWFMDAVYRGLPHLRSWYDRRTRMYDKFSVYFLPGTSVFFYQFWDICFGFKFLSILPWFLLYVRTRDRTLDPDFKETYLRDMIYQNPEINKLFNEDTIHVLDYDCEYDSGLPDADKFPEFQNKVFQFFNTDTSMTTGFFKMGDVESGAVMNLKFKTMPAPGKFRYQVGEPFYFYDLRADITHKGVLKEVVLVDEKEVLKKMRPFLFLI